MERKMKRERDDCKEKRVSLEAESGERGRGRESLVLEC